MREILSDSKISPAVAGNRQDPFVSVGHNVGVVFDVEVVPEDGCYELRQAWVAGIGGIVEGVLAIAIGVIEADAFRRVAEALGFLQGVKVDNRHLLAHLAGHAVVAGDGTVGCCDVANVVGLRPRYDRECHAEGRFYGTKGDFGL